MESFFYYLIFIKCKTTEVKEDSVSFIFHTTKVHHGHFFPLMESGKERADLFYPHGEEKNLSPLCVAVKRAVSAGRDAAFKPLCSTSGEMPMGSTPVMGLLTVRGEEIFSRSAKIL